MLRFGPWCLLPWGRQLWILQFVPPSPAWLFPKLIQIMLNSGIHHATAWACCLPFLPLNSTGHQLESRRFPLNISVNIWKLLLQRAWKVKRHCVRWWMESSRGHKSGLELQLMIWLELNQGNGINVAFWTLSKESENCKAENYNSKAGGWLVYS